MRHAAARLAESDAAGHSSLRGAGDVAESCMILQLSEAFGLSEGALVQAAADTARKRGSSISNVILWGWLDYCAPRDVWGTGDGWTGG